jgi:hypothetical protein
VRRNYPLLIILACQVLTFSCENDSAPEFKLKGPGLYVMGTKDTGTTWPQLYCWKDGEEVLLGDGSKHFFSTSIAVTSGDVYVAGIHLTNGVSRPVYWKNGILHSLSEHATASSSVTDIAISGDDVFIAFNEGNDDGISVAKYWKNGNVIPLSNGTKAEGVISIFVSGNDVYAAGYEEQGGDSPLVAKYWKNGEDFTLTSGQFQAVAASIFVDGDDVYVAGYEYAFDEVTNWSYPIAKYWKNGEEVILGDYNSHAKGIEVHEGIVYVVGDQFKFVDEVAVTEIKYWKDGEAFLMNDIGDCSNGRVMTVSQDGSQVYVVGDDRRIWVNTVPHLYFNGTQSESVIDIFLVE